MSGEVFPFRRPRLTPEEGRAAAVRVLATPIERRIERMADLRLEDPETILPLLSALRRQSDSSPREALAEAKFLYDFLAGLHPRYPLDTFLLDEREYFLGETAWIAGAVCRGVSRHDDARRWLDLAEGWFLLSENAAGNLSRVGYQRLALRIEEGEFQIALELLPRLVESFERLGMREDAAKSRFLKGIILEETDRADEAREVFQAVVQDAEALGDETLRATALARIGRLASARRQSLEALGQT